MNYTESVRRVLSDEGWLHPVKTALRQPVQIDELQCPDCNSDAVVMYDDDASMVTVIGCRNCEAESRVALTQLLRR